MLTIALAKGRLAEKAMERFSAIGMDCLEMQEKSRKLIFENTQKEVNFFLAKAGDVPTYVEHGAADMGVAGKDTLLEENRGLYEVYDFGFGKCRMAVCGPKNAVITSNGLRVATKYPTIAANYFESRGITIELIRLGGSVELAPIVGLSDVIVDIVETGSTLAENGLEVLEEICPLSARLVVNRVSMKLEHERIKEIVKRLKTGE
jgi:ATP phosphoribosyltransferase